MAREAFISSGADLAPDHSFQSALHKVLYKVVKCHYRL